MKNNHNLHNRNFAEAFNNAVNGIVYTVKTQSSIKKQLIIAFIVIIASLFLNLTKIEMMVVTFAIFLVIILETVNTAIETIVDMYVSTYNEKAKLAKDVGAGAVLLASINAVIIALFIFPDKIIEIIRNIGLI